MVAVVQDLKWPFPGDKVTLTATSQTGNRARFYLATKPTESTLELWDFEKQNWFDGTDKNAWFTPDTDGTYGVTCVDTTISVNPPHYDGHGATGSGIGVGVVTTNATTNHTVYVGAILTRQVGFPPDNVTVTVRSHAIGTASYGCLTYYAGTVYAPTLSGATTDLAKQSVRSTAVVSAMAAIGASGYAGTSLMLPWGSVIDSTPFDSILYALGRFNNHTHTTSHIVHLLEADGGATSAVATAAFSTLASAIARINAWVAAWPIHKARTTYGGDPPPLNIVHSPADTYTATVAALATSANTSALAAHYSSCANRFNYHLAIVPTTATSAVVSMNLVHYAPGDSIREVTETAPTGLPSACTAIRTLCQQYMKHRTRYGTNVVTGSTNYHSTSAAQTLFLNMKNVADWGQACYVINTMLDALDYHVLNKEYPGGTSTVFHTSTSAGGFGRTDTIPRASPSDRDSILLAMEAFDRAFAIHIAAGSPTHTISTNNGVWRKTPTGVALVHRRFTDELLSSTGTAPVNENAGSAKLIKFGGFSKV
jgi:hypothetical protein